MSTITAILEPDVDGSLHLPLPPELRHGKVRIEARLELVTPLADAPAKKGTPWEAFQELRKLGGMKYLIKQKYTSAYSAKAGNKT
jgi:hypothetical protein